MAKSVVPPPMSTSATPSSFSSGVSTASLAASCSSTVSTTATPARFTQATMFCVDEALPVTTWTFTSSRRRSCRPARRCRPVVDDEVLRQHVQDLAPAGQRHGLGGVDRARTSSRVISRFLPATATTPRLLNALTCAPDSARCTSRSRRRRSARPRRWPS
jgi:hypothetical protein